MLNDVGGIPVVQASSGGDGMLGGGMGWLGIILIIALLGGGNGGLFGGNKGVAASGFETASIENTVNRSAQFSELSRGIQGLASGQCDSTYALNNSIKDGNYANAMAMQQGFNNLGNGICNSTFATTTAINNLGTQLQQCCCNLEHGIERSTAAVIQNNNANTQRVFDLIVSNKMETLNKELCEKNQQLSEQRIIAHMKPVAPIPAYQVSNPYGGVGCQNVACC